MEGSLIAESLCSSLLIILAGNLCQANILIIRNNPVNPVRIEVHDHIFARISAFLAS
jgi:hypothetical protein